MALGKSATNRALDACDGRRAGEDASPLQTWSSLSLSRSPSGGLGLSSSSSFVDDSIFGVSSRLLEMFPHYPILMIMVAWGAL